METRGKTSCSGGNLISDKETCITACDDLKIPKKSILGGYVCYKDSRGYCYQNGHNGAGASMVCTNKGSAAPPSEWKIIFPSHINFSKLFQQWLLFLQINEFGVLFPAKANDHWVEKKVTYCVYRKLEKFLMYF